MCGEEEEDIEHVMERCEKTGELEEKWSKHFKNERKTVTRLKRIIWVREHEKRKKEEKERDN